MRVGKPFTCNGAPRLEPLLPCRECAHPRLYPVRDHHQRVVGKERRQLGFVGLQLLKGRINGGVLVRRVLQLDQDEREAVNEDQHVGTTGVLVLRNCELINHQPVVVVRTVEVNHTGLRPRNAPIRMPVLHRHPVHQ